MITATHLKLSLLQEQSDWSGISCLGPKAKTVSEVFVMHLFPCCQEIYILCFRQSLSIIWHLFDIYVTIGMDCSRRLISSLLKFAPFLEGRK